MIHPATRTTGHWFLTASAHLEFGDKQLRKRDTKIVDATSAQWFDRDEHAPLIATDHARMPRSTIVEAGKN